MEPLDVIIGLLIGVIVGSSVLYILLKRLSFGKSQEKGKKLTSLHLPFQGKIIQTPELVKAKKDVKTLALEKELLSSAITRVFEAEALNDITKDERDVLCKKYREQLRSVEEEKLGNIESLIEVGELENLHDELVGLFERKIKQLEDRLHQAKTKVEITRGIQIPSKLPVKIEQKAQKSKVISEESKVDQKVKEIKDEVLDALTKLEQIDMEK